MTTATRVDVASLFLETARRLGDIPALIRRGEITPFTELARDVERLSSGLLRAGLNPGERVALLVPPSRDLYAATFAMFRAGLVPVLIDPGIGFKNMGRCLAESEPAAFIGSPKAHLARILGGWAPTSRLNIVADGFVPGIPRLRDFQSSTPLDAAPKDMEEPAAVLFTSGSTGAPKGALYTHGIFAAQVGLLRSLFDIKEGEVSVPTFPLFGLFDAALGQTCVLPEMDFTRPGGVDPRAVIGPLQKYSAQQLFGSPALLDRLGRFGEKHGIALPSLRRVMSAGAPVPARVLERFSKMLPAGVHIFTPYGATEALPVALIGSDEILEETAAMTAMGQGVCVGRPVAGAEVDIIRISDAPIKAWDGALRAIPGEIGEIVVKGPMVSASYLGRPEAAALSKIPDGARVRHRMGDLGRLDEKGRLWFCGRKAQRVRTPDGVLYTIPVEGVFNAHPAVKRTALVRVGHQAVL
ncbi:MAG: peptide synthase, partial [Elusimicrobia bacterium RIFOXYD12_FULL_66_9]